MVVERVNSPPGDFVTVLCDATKRIELWLRSGTRLSDEDVDRVDVDVLAVGPTLAAVQSGQRP